MPRTYQNDVHLQLSVPGVPTLQPDLQSHTMNPSTDSKRAASTFVGAGVTASIAMAITLIPYLVGFGMSRGRQFMWLGYNLDDSCVYLSWMRQSADGATRTLNLFTTDRQHGLVPNLLFWVLGRTAALTHLPLIWIYHLSRVTFGIALIIATWQFIRLVVRSVKARFLALCFVCFSAGLGWLVNPLVGPFSIDLWQPEATTYLSLFLSPLFCFSLLLQVVTVAMLVIGVRTGRTRFAVGAGVFGCVLGLTHTYDVLTMAAVWAAYLVVSTILGARRQLGMRRIALPWIQGLVAGLITLPSVAFMAYELKTETIFLQRANVETLSPAFVWVLLGYGLTLVFAVLGAAMCRGDEAKLEREGRENPWYFDDGSRVLLIVWAIVNVAVAYIPLPFQRKLLQGAHIPIALLAGIGAAWVWSRIGARATNSRFALYALATTLLLCPSNILFMGRDVANYARGISQTQLHRTYLQPGEIAALEWIKNNSTPGAAVQPLPWLGRTNPDAGNQIFTKDAALMCFTPGLVDRPVYCGHWGETPRYREKLSDLALFSSSSPRWDEAKRFEFLRSMHVRYLVFSQKHADDTSEAGADATDSLLPRFRGRLPLPEYLKLRYSNADADVYEVTN